MQTPGPNHQDEHLMPHQTQQIHRCPCCGSPQPANQIKAIKRNINRKLAILTNPPSPVDTFLVAARDILDEYGIDPSPLLNIGGYAHGQPGWARNPLPEWDTVLVLGWCYNKMEVAYFS